MHVKLRILKGPNQGKEVKIPTPKCIIGRGEGSHIKAQSDAVSRQHCVIETNAKEVLVRDLQSRNGTIVNDERINGDTPLLSGDILRVGPLEFEVIVEVDVIINGKRPAVSGVQDVLERTAQIAGGAPGGTTMDLGKVNKWLDEADASAKRNPETKQFKIDETDSEGIQLKKSDVVSKAELEAKLKAEEEAKKKAEEEAKKKVPAKLPPPPVQTSKNSREAAGDFLKRMFRK